MKNDAFSDDHDGNQHAVGGWNELLPGFPLQGRGQRDRHQASARGSQTFISICESDEGVSTAATRQCAGNVPAGTSSAAAILPWTSDNNLSPPQGVCDSAVKAVMAKRKVGI